MIRILVANAKGGTGKTTLATNLASAFAAAGLSTALADADRQRSALGWLKRRPVDAAPIAGLDWRKGAGDVPQDVERLVIDSGAGLASPAARGLIAEADVVVVPFIASEFDRVASRRFLRRIGEIKAIRKGRKDVLLVANRVRAGARGVARVAAVAADLGEAPAARLADLAVYQDVAAAGLGIFDLPPARRARAVGDWIGLIHAIERGDA